MTPSNASSELSNSNSSYYGGGAGGCEDPTQIMCDSASGLSWIYAYRVGVIVYYVAGVHVAVVYNAYAFITAGRHVALWTPRHPFSRSTSLLRDEIINSIATNLRV